MSNVHGLNELLPSLTVKGETLERVKKFKLLGTWFNENLKWSDHINHLVTSSYGILATLNIDATEECKEAISRKSYPIQIGLQRYCLLSSSCISPENFSVYKMPQRAL